MSTEDAAKVAADARDRLADTLDQIEDKINIPKKIGRWTKQASSSYEENPVPFVVGGVVAIASVVGLIAWGIVSSTRD